MCVYNRDTNNNTEQCMCNAEEHEVLYCALACYKYGNVSIGVNAY